LSAVEAGIVLTGTYITFPTFMREQISELLHALRMYVFFRVA
jgi:hypothetical protein